MSSENDDRMFNTIWNNECEVHAERMRILDNDKQRSFERSTPFMVYGATLVRDGNAYLALLGDLPTGVSGSGDTPAEAVADFNKAWNTKTPAPCGTKEE